MVARYARVSKHKIIALRNLNFIVLYIIKWESLSARAVKSVITVLLEDAKQNMRCLHGLPRRVRKLSLPRVR